MSEEIVDAKCAPTGMTKTDFDSEARSFVTALRRLNSTGIEDSALIRWEIEGCGADLFLVHPPVLRELVPRTELAGRSGSSDCEVGNFEEESCDVDETVVPSNTALSEWELSVVYSETWSVPVLYFRAQYSDGTAMPRSDILNMLEYDSSESNSWDFISEEEHPITGMPSFFLHPCQTSARMELLHKSMCSQRDGINQKSKLLRWISMMLPAVNLRLSPGQYAKLANCMVNTS